MKALKEMFVTIGLILAISAAAFATVTYTPRDLVFQDRIEGPYQMSAVPEELRYLDVVVFVDDQAANASDSDDDIHGRSWYTPFATIAYAESVLPTTGGLICVAPGHTEEVIASTTLDLNVANTYILGFGKGNDRPKINVGTAATAVVHLDAANTGIYNCQIIDTLEGGTPLTTMVKTSGDYWALVDCYFAQGGATDGDANGTSALTIGVADGDSDYGLVKNCRFHLPATANWAQAITFAKDMTGVVIEDTQIYGDFSNAAIDIPSGGNAQVDLQIRNCILTNTETGDHALQVNGTGNTGAVINPVFLTDGTYVDAGGLQLVNMLTGTIGSDSDTGSASSDSASIAAILADTAAQDTASELRTLLNAAAAEIAAEPNQTIIKLGTSVLISNTDVNVADGTVDDVFTVTGGPILCEFLGVVFTEAASNNSVTLGFTSDPTAGAGTDTPLSSGVDVDSVAIGSWVFTEGDGTAAVIAALGTTVPLVGGANSGSGFIIPAGGVDIEMQSANLTTGIVTAYMIYKPLASGVTVAAP